MLTVRDNWDSREVGLFINLQAFAKCPDFMGPDARLPSWNTIVTDYPHLIDQGAAERPRRFFVTHRWDDSDHPDPRGWQLRALRALAFHYNYRSESICFWYDYMSLPQRKPRTPEEAEIFQSGLRHIRQLVGSCENLSLISRHGDNHGEDREAMLQRGWVVAELFIARSRINISLPLYEREADPIEYGRTQYRWDDVVPDLHAVAPLDTPAELHAWFEHKGISCTNGSDLAFLAEQLHDELHLFDDVGPEPPPAVTLGVEMELEDDEMVRLALVDSNGISMRVPNLFLKAAKRDVRTGVWTVMFVERPPSIGLGVWSPLSDGELKARLIDQATWLSPMYPGARFEVSADGTQLRAVLA